MVMNEPAQLSCVRPLSIVTRNAVLIKAIPSETMKWKCHFVGSCANCVAEKGAHTAPKPDDEILNTEVIKLGFRRQTV